MSSPRRGDAIDSVLVLVPTYNERENLPMIVRRLRQSVPDADLLVLDDNSPDGTGVIADELAAADGRVHVMHRSGKQGLGAAYLAGFAWGLERGYDALVEIDADGSHQPEQLPRLIDAVRGGADLAIGSRWIRGGSVQNWPRSRKALSVGANIYTKVALGMSVNDATAGFRVYRATALHAMSLEGVLSQGYCFQVDLTRRAIDAGLRVVEVPIDFVERTVGESKMNQSIIVEAFGNVARWGLERRAGQVRRALARGRGGQPGRRQDRERPGRSPR